jgi:hypothetical protein
MMQPPFHWNDRDTIVAWLPIFETGNMKTSDMKAEAKQALAKLN